MFGKTIGAWLGAAVIAASTLACSQSDPGVTTAVKSKLAADDTVKAYRIDVDTKDGVVTLNGTADTQANMSKAQTIARGIEGVKSVDNKLTVKP